MSSTEMDDRQEEEDIALKSRFHPVRIPTEKPLASTKLKDQFFNQDSTISTTLLPEHIVSQSMIICGLRLKRSLLRDSFF
jgi:hypothetical protein